MEMLIKRIGWSQLTSICNLSNNWCYEDRTIGVTRIGQLGLRGWDNILITDAATTTTHAVFFHTLISYKRLRYIQPRYFTTQSLTR